MQTRYSRQVTPARMPRNRVSPPADLRHDEELLAAYVETGSRDAFEELLRRYERELYSYLCHYLGDAQLAEDAFQNTFLQVHLKCRQFEPGLRLRPWMYKIATSQAVDLLRRNRRHKAVSFSAAADAGTDQPPWYDLRHAKAADPVARWKLQEDREQVRLAVCMLPEKARHVLILVVCQGLKYREAAEALGIPLGTVKSRLHGAIESLRKALLSVESLAEAGRSPDSFFAAKLLWSQ